MKTYRFAKITSTNGEIFRTEKIDLLNNPIFKNSNQDKFKIKKIYEKFWGKGIYVQSIAFSHN